MSANVRDCWRCDATTPHLVNDPLMRNPRDSIGICPTCTEVRGMLAMHYDQRGTLLTIVEPENDRVLAKADYLR